MADEPVQTHPFPNAAISALEQGHTIEAIKIIREERGLALKESKDLVDAYLGSRPDLKRRLDAAQAGVRQGAIRWLAFLLVLAAAAAYVLTRSS